MILRLQYLLFFSGAFIFHLATVHILVSLHPLFKDKNVHYFILWFGLGTWSITAAAAISCNRVWHVVRFLGR